MVEFDYDNAARTLVCRFAGVMDNTHAGEAGAAVVERLREIGGIAEGGDAASDLKLVFDLEKVQYASSVFLRIVVMAAKRVKKGNFAVSGASPFARDMLKTAALEQLLGRPFGDTE